MCIKITKNIFYFRSYHGTNPHKFERGKKIWTTNFRSCLFLDREIRNVLLKIEKNIAENVSEIRLRCERPVALTLLTDVRYI